MLMFTLKWYYFHVCYHYFSEAFYDSKRLPIIYLFRLDYKDLWFNPVAHTVRIWSMFHQQTISTYKSSNLLRTRKADIELCDSWFELVDFRLLYCTLYCNLGCISQSTAYFRPLHLREGNLQHKIIVCVASRTPSLPSTNKTTTATAKLVYLPTPSIIALGVAQTNWPKFGSRLLSSTGWNHIPELNFRTSPL